MMTAQDSPGEETGNLREKDIPGCHIAISEENRATATISANDYREAKSAPPPRPLKNPKNRRVHTYTNVLHEAK
jgi:hypothetical protein